MFNFKVYVPFVVAVKRYSDVKYAPFHFLSLVEGTERILKGTVFYSEVTACLRRNSYSVTPENILLSEKHLKI